MTSRVAHLVAIPLTLALALAVGACSDNPAPRTSPDGPTVEAETPSPSVQEATPETTIPEPDATEKQSLGNFHMQNTLGIIGLGETDLEQAGYAAIAFEIAYGAAMISGDPSELRTLSGLSCKLCNDAIARTESLAAQGHHLKEGEIVAVEELYVANPTPEIGADYYTAVVFGEMLPKTIIDADGNEVESIDGGLYAEVADLEKVEGQWRIVEIGRVSDEDANLVLGDRPFEKIDVS